MRTACVCIEVKDVGRILGLPDDLTPLPWMPLGEEENGQSDWNEPDLLE